MSRRASLERHHERLEKTLLDEHRRGLLSDYQYRDAMESLAAEMQEEFRAAREQDEYEAMERIEDEWGW